MHDGLLYAHSQVHPLHDLHIYLRTSEEHYMQLTTLHYTMNLFSSHPHFIIDGLLIEEPRSSPLLNQHNTVFWRHYKLFIIQIVHLYILIDLAWSYFRFLHIGCCCGRSWTIRSCRRRRITTSCYLINYERFRSTWWYSYLQLSPSAEQVDGCYELLELYKTSSFYPHSAVGTSTCRYIESANSRKVLT